MFRTSIQNLDIQKRSQHTHKNCIRSWRRSGPNRLRYLKTWSQLVVLLGEVTLKVQSCWRKSVIGDRIHSLAPLPAHPLVSSSWFKIRCLSCLLQVPAAMPPLASQSLPWKSKVKINSFRSGCHGVCITAAEKKLIQKGSQKHWRGSFKNNSCISIHEHTIGGVTWPPCSRVLHMGFLPWSHYNEWSKEWSKDLRKTGISQVMAFDL